MIILLGPDGTGKTTLAKTIEKQGLGYIHYTKDSNYEDYINPLANLELTNAVLDRHAICEYPYYQVMKREFKFSLKEFHNVMLLTLAHNPLIILCNHKPSRDDYAEDQYMPYEQWDRCLALYLHFLNSHRIVYLSYDYENPYPLNTIMSLHNTRRHNINWWIPMWKAGYGFVGSHSPDTLLVAERMGPNNVNTIPFETGPTGYMLSDTIGYTETPLGKFAVSNFIKDFRGSKRQPIQEDFDLLDMEIRYLKPKKILFMGAVARKGITVAKRHNIPTYTMTHFGAYNHKGISDVSKLPKMLNEWTTIIKA